MGKRERDELFSVLTGKGPSSITNGVSSKGNLLS
jgi:hypothetical protein